MLDGRRLILLVACVLVGACQSSGSDAADQPIVPDSNSAAAPSAPTDTTSPPMVSTGVELRLDRTEYASRADVQLTMVSRHTGPLGYNSCTRQVERENAGAWALVPEPDRVCTMELRILGRGETITETTDLPQLQPGRYRIALSFSDEGSGSPVRAVSQPFAVR